MQRILIHTNLNPKSKAVKYELEKLLYKHRIQVVSSAPDAVVVIGGDGTVLTGIRKYHHLKVPFIGIDTGTLGFLDAIMPEALGSILDVFRLKNYKRVYYPLISVRMSTFYGEEIVDHAFNEVIIKHYEPRLMQTKLYINSKPFNHFTGDGFIVSTPIGATGYAIWAGGAVLHPDVGAYQITPLAPNDNSVNRPLTSSMVIPNDAELDFRVVNAQKRKVMVACDGVRITDEYIQDIHIALLQDQVEILRPEHFDYFDLFKRKVIDKDVRRKISD